ncbi:MAG: hypothetical protein ACHQD8_01515 [Chitinophagales bacterium]
MKHISRTLPVLISVLIALVINNGCRENTIINSRVSPSNNAVGVYDTTLSCITHTYYNDTVVTSYHFNGVIQGLGTYTDSFFGTMTAAIYFNIIPSDYTPLVDALIDSAILVLPYSGFTYGDTITKTLTQTYQVFYMLDTIDYNSTYYAYSTKPIDAAHSLSDPTTVNVYHLKDSLGVNVLPQNQAGLRIKLNLPIVKSRLIPALNNLSGSSSPAADFLHTFNGICVQVADTRQFNTAIPYFQLDGVTGPYSEAGILIYHHDSGLHDTVVTPYYFDIGTCAHFNNVTKSYSHFPVNNLFQSTQSNDQVIAVQNEPGASIDVIVPGIKNLPAGIINKAELQFTLLPGYGNYIQTPGGPILFAPERINPTGIGNSTYPTGIGNGLLYTIADMYPIYSSTPLNVIDGTLHNPYPGTTLAKFTVDIPREVMASIAAKNDTIHLHIDGSQNFYGAFHLVAGGGSYPDPLYRAKLFVVYSKLKN